MIKVWTLREAMDTLGVCLRKGSSQLFPAQRVRAPDPGGRRSFGYISSRIDSVAYETD